MKATRSSWWFAAALATAGLWLSELEHEELGWLSAAVLLGWIVARKQSPRRLFIAIVAASPFITIPLRATTATVLSYARGTATLPRTTSGKPSAESGNLDPTYRVFSSGGPCTTDFGSWVAAVISRATLVALLRSVGPMPGAYLGAYPKPREARALVARSGIEVDPSAWSSGELNVGSRRVRVGRRWLDRVGAAPPERIAAAVVKDLAIVLVETQSDEFISLIDLGRVGWFATYRSTRGS
jgi:hypothetical protein